jgi:transcriptional regulator with XRE-family HTH domain
MASPGTIHVCPECGHTFQPIDGDERTLGGRIRAARQRANLSLIELGRSIGTSSSNIVHYEANNVRVMRPATLRKFADALGVSPLWLAMGD